MTKHFVLPDVQAKHGNSFDFLRKLGQFVVKKRPDVIVCIGDFADMPSLSSYDAGKKCFEGRRYYLDVEATKLAMQTFMQPIREYQAACIANKKKQYNPRFVLTLGNHEDRINRAINNDAKLDGLISVKDLNYEAMGWEVYPFLEVVNIDNILYSHYFPTGLAGRAAATANAQLAKQHASCISGHQQGLQIATAYRGDGHRLTSIIAGSCYEHNEDYLGKQGNNHWRGALILHEVNNGEFDLMPVSLNYLNKKFK